MNDNYNFMRFSIRLLIIGIGLISSAQAHYPHDNHEFIELSPDYANDHTAFIAPKQASSIRPVTALVSRDGGATWEFNAKGMDNLPKISSAIASPIYQTDKTVLLTTGGQGVFRTVDGGLSWAKINNGLTDLSLHASAAALDSQGGVTYFVTATAGGLYRLLPGSLTWTQQIEATTVVTAIAVSPAYSLDQTLLIADQFGRLSLSTDAGETFSQLTLSTGTGLVTQIKFTADYAASGEVFIGTSSGLFVSTDYLTTLSPVAGFSLGWVSALALSPSYRADATLFLTTPTEGVYKSIDRGLSWVLNQTGVGLSAQSDFHFYDLKLSRNFSDDGTIFLATFEGLFRSTDFGNSWLELETRPPTLIMDVAMSPGFAQDGLMLVSTYGGGLYVTEDAGVNWRVSANGVSSPHLYQVAIRENPGSDPILVTSHANHLLVSHDKGNSWTEKEVSNLIPEGCIASNMGISPNFANDGTAYLGCRRSGIVVTHDAGETWSLVLNAQQLDDGVVTSIVLSPDYAVDQTLMISEHRGIFAKSVDEGLNWQLTLNGLPTPGRWYGGRSLVFSPDYKNDRAIAAVTESGVYGTLDDGSTWYPIPDWTSPVANGVIESLAISPDAVNDKTAFTSVRGKGLYRTEDGALSWQQVGRENSVFRYDIQNTVISPNFANDGLVIGYGHDHLFRSLDRGTTFTTIDIPFVRHEEHRKQSVLYKGNWFAINNSLASGTSFKASITPGEEVSLVFVGTGVRWIGALANMLGKADVFIDDVLVSTVDQYGEIPALQQVLYEVENLQPTTHEIRVVVNGDRNPASFANWVIIDAFDVIR